MALLGAGLAASLVLLLQQLLQSHLVAAQVLPTTTPGRLLCVEQLSSCSCRVNDGRIIDLSPLQAYPGPAFNYKSPDEYTYQYNPCGAFKCGTEGDAAMCQEKFVIIPTFADFGIQTSAKFDFDAGTNQIRLNYLSHDMSKRSTVSLICDPSAADASFHTDGAQSGNMLSELRSRYACPFAPQSGGISGGDVLLIVCFTMLAVYVIASVLINRLVRGRTTLAETLPNYTFWSSLPGLVADGSAFVYGKSRDLVMSKRSGYSDVK